MKQLLAVVALLGLTGLGLSAQETTSPQSTPSTQTTPTNQSPNTTSQESTDAQSQQQTQQSFEGKITKSGDQLILKDRATQTSYQLDDQDKAKQYVGQNVKIMATMDPNYEHSPHRRYRTFSG
jgi:hypothetical protein